MAEKRYYNPEIHDKHNTPYGYDGGARNGEESTPRRRRPDSDDEEYRSNIPWTAWTAPPGDSGQGMTPKSSIRKGSYWSSVSLK